MILEFSESFSQLLNTRDFFPGGLTLDLIERALIEKEVSFKIFKLCLIEKSSI